MSSAVDIPNTEGAAERRPNLPALTSIRFFLAAMVVLAHYRAYIAPNLLPESTAAGFGISAVTGFFVLSGFILTYQYWNEDRAVDKRKFFRARFGRIVPLYWFSLLFALAIVPLNILPGGPNYAFGLIASIFLLQSWVDNSNICFGINPPNYTLSIEAFFYAVFPFIVEPFTRKIWLWLSILIVACMALPIAVPTNDHTFLLYVCPLVRIPDFMIGVAGAVAFRRNKLEPFVARCCVLAVVALGLTVPMGLAPVHSATDQWQTGIDALTRLAYASLFGIVVCILAQQKGKVSALLSWAPLVVLGEASYAMYLLHDPLIISLKGNNVPFLTTAGILNAAVLSLIIIAVALAGYTFVETPWRKAIMRWGRDKFPRNLKWQSAGLACAIALLYCAHSGKFDQPYTSLREHFAQPVAEVTHIAFGDSAQLDTLYMWKVPQGIEVCTHWHALAKPDEGANLGVHIVDEQGKILHQLDHAFRRNEQRDWQDRFVIPADQLVGAKSIALALFKDPNQTLQVSSGPRDWGGHRLLTPLPDLRN